MECFSSPLGALKIKDPATKVIHLPYPQSRQRKRWGHQLSTAEIQKTDRAFLHDVMAAILVFQNNETATMLVFQTNPVGIELFSHANAFLRSSKFA